MIACRDLADGQTYLYGWHLEAELAGIPPDAILDNAADLERRTLAAFAAHLGAYPKKRWAHWGLSGIDYGFPALVQRAAVRQVAEFAMPRHLHDLSEVLKQAYGSNYVDHPRLNNLIDVNQINNHQLLLVERLTAAFRAGDFRSMATSLQRKVFCISQILELHLGRRLRTSQTESSPHQPGAEVSGWIGCARSTLAVRASPIPFVPTDLQREILELLHENALTLDGLSDKLGAERSYLYRSIDELRSQGLVANSRRWLLPDRCPTI